MRKATFIILSLTLLISAFGCSTVEGLGKDIKKVGQKLEDASEKN